jgi:lysophospholipase L1-like esterase
MSLKTIVRTVSRSWLLKSSLALGLFVALVACTGSRHPEPLAAEVPPKIELTTAELRFEPEINAFDSLLTTAVEPKEGIVFTGSSSIKKWETLIDDMAPLPVANRGFGGAIIRQVTYYSNRMLVPLKPKLLVFYCGENDIANDFNGPELPLKDFKTFVTTIRHKLPDVGILFVSMKPSPLRMQWWPKFQAANKMVKEYIATQKNMWYSDVTQAMLQRNGRPTPDLFLGDSLHMNAKGYALWTQILKPQVGRLYDQLKQKQND